MAAVVPAMPETVGVALPVFARMYLQLVQPAVVLRGFLAELFPDVNADAQEGSKEKKRTERVISHDAQRLFLRTTLLHPIAVRYPPRDAYVLAMAKLLVSTVEEHYRRHQVSAASVEVGNEEEEDEGALCEELIEFYMNLVVCGSPPTAASNSESSSALCVGGMCGMNAEKLLKDESAMHYTTFALTSHPSAPTSSNCSREGEDASVRYMTFRVAPSFTNVGLAPWPSAFVAVALLLEAGLGASSPPSTAAAGIHDHDMMVAPGEASEEHRRCVEIVRRLVAEAAAGVNGEAVDYGEVRVVELGAGIGLTGPALLQGQGGSGGIVSRVVMTDYQLNIVSNCAYNQDINGLCDGGDDATTSSDVGTAAAGRKTRCTCSSELLDWTEHDSPQQLSRLAGWDGNVILAADCIYDRTVIAPLAHTIKQCLELQDACSASTPEGSSCSHSRRRVCFVVQTHRNEATLAEFFATVEELGIVVEHSMRFAPPSSSSASSSPGCVGGGGGGGCGGSRDGGLVEVAPFRAASMQQLHNREGDHDGGGDASACLLDGGFVGPYYVEMMGLVHVHALRLR